MTRNFICFIFILTAIFSATAWTAQATEVAKYGKVMTDGTGLEISMVRYGDEDARQYLAEIKGVDNPLDGKVVLLTASGGGTSATYYTMENGKNLMRQPSHGWFGWEAYIGGKTYTIGEDPRESKKLKTSEILKTYKKQQNK